METMINERSITADRKKLKLRETVLRNIRNLKSSTDEQNRIRAINFNDEVLRQDKVYEKLLKESDPKPYFFLPGCSNMAAYDFKKIHDRTMKEEEYMALFRRYG